MISKRAKMILDQMSSGGVLYMYYGSTGPTYWCLQKDGVQGDYKYGMPVSKDLINRMVAAKLIVIEPSTYMTRAVLR
jgi:hypothetical protein